jgi:hypothetical protein
MNINIRLGADPEVVVMNGDNPVSAVPLIGGTKHAPVFDSEGTAFSNDNVLAEFAITPSDSVEEFSIKISQAKHVLVGMLPAGHSIKAVASIIFPASELRDDAAWQFGCDPDADAYALRENDMPDPPKDGMRSCGGHIHVGAAAGSEFLLDPWQKINMIKALDTTVGMVLTTFCVKDVESRRRKLYGKAGCHRPKEYGVEYRTPSCAWIDNDLRCKLVGSLANDAARMVATGQPTADMQESDVIDIINTCDPVRACEVVQRLISMGLISSRSFKLLGACA